MKIVFFGTPGFAATNLEYLHKNGVEILQVISAQTNKKGEEKR